MNIKETFLKLTSKTYPHGFEDELVSILPKDHSSDEHGNYYVKIGESRTAFTCHLDTACSTQVDVKHVFEGNIIKTDGSTILGADDKAGVTVLLYMIEKKVPGLYCFFIGEEVGCIGSGLASKNKSFKSYDRMISFDRRGTGSIITFQSSRRCCSDDFANSLSKNFNKFGLKMSPDDTGVYTDSAEFTDIIPECTNVSVGYYKEHTHQEHQDIQHLVRLCQASVRINWEELPTKRNPKSTEYKNSYGGNWRNYNRNYNTHVPGSKYKKKNYSRNGHTYDDWYDQTYPSNFIKSNLKETKSGRTYYNDLDNDITDYIKKSDIDRYESKSKNYYETLKQYIFDDKLTAGEFERLKNNYLDMDNPNDREFYDEMMSIL